MENTVETTNVVLKDIYGQTLYTSVKANTWIKALKEALKKKTVSLKGLDASNQQITDVSFEGKNLEQARFTKSKLSGVSFDECKLDQACFNTSQLDNVKFIKSKLKGVHFNDRVIANKLYFQDDYIEGISFTNSELNETTFNVTELAKVDFLGATLDVKFRDKSRLNQVVFDFSNIVNASGTLMKIANCSLIDVRASKVEFPGASVTNTNFLDGAIKKLDLTSAQFYQSRLDGVSVDSMLCNYLTVHQSDIQNNTIKKLRGSIGTWEQVHLKGNSIKDCSLVNVEVKNCHFTGNIWENALVINSSFSNVKFKEEILSDSNWSSSKAEACYYNKCEQLNSKMPAGYKVDLMKNKRTRFPGNFGTSDLPRATSKSLSIKDILHSQGI